VVVVPSIWWENAPTVMQEAARNGRAVVCSDIGGMAEMAAEIGAAVFPVGSAGDLAAVLRDGITRQGSYINDPVGVTENSVPMHKTYYHSVLTTCN
jgi:glycosyltransferase involved in cell wall biosynthesis